MKSLWSMTIVSLPVLPKNLPLHTSLVITSTSMTEHANWFISTVSVLPAFAVSPYCLCIVPLTVPRQEFYVRFKGPEESMYAHICLPMATTNNFSPFPGRTMEDPRRAPGPISLQESKHRLREPYLPPKHRRAVRLPLDSLGNSTDFDYLQLGQRLS